MNERMIWLHKQFELAGRDEQHWNGLLTRFGDETLSSVSRYGVLLLTPDLIEQNLIAQIFQWFRKWKADPVAVVPYLFTPPETALLYAGRITHKTQGKRTHSAWLSTQLYSLGTSIFIMLRAEQATLPLQEQIRNSKGRSLYGAHKTNEIRGMSRIADRCFSLIHSPDDYEGFFHESEFILGSTGTKIALHPNRPALCEEDLIALTAKIYLSEEPHLFDLIFRLLKRGLALFLTDPRTLLPQPTLRDLFKKVSKEQSYLKEVEYDSLLVEEAWKALGRLAPDLAELLKQQRDFVGNTSFSWDELRLANARIELCSIMEAFCYRDAFKPRLGFAAIEVFQRNHLTINAWDQHRLHVLIAFHGTVG